MRKLLRSYTYRRVLILIGICLVGPGCTSLNQATIKITDVEGTPLSGADVRVGSAIGTGGGSINNSAPGSKIIQDDRGKTDDKGEYFFFGFTSRTVHISAKKEGYYGGSTFLGEKHSIVLPLRPKINPVSAYIKSKSIKFPSDKGVFGFDVVVGDLVKPFGKGDHADFLFEIKPVMWQFSESKPAKKMLGGDIKIDQPGGGFVAHYQAGVYSPRSDFNRPYHAPATGYVASIRESKKKAPKKDNGQPLGWHWADGKHERAPYVHYYFKTRTDSPSGPIYGIVKTYFSFRYRGLNHDIPTASFKYLYNSDRTSNLEIERL